MADMMRSATLLTIAGALVLVGAGPAGAQIGGSPTTGLSGSLGLGVDLTRRQTGVTLEARGTRTNDLLSHVLGVSASVAPLLWVESDCLPTTCPHVPEDRAALMLYTGFYELHYRFPAGDEPERYIGLRLSGVLGWDGKGAGAGFVFGTVARSSDRSLARFDVITDFLFTDEYGGAGVAWPSLRVGVRVGLGVRRRAGRPPGP